MHKVVLDVYIIPEFPVIALLKIIKSLYLNYKKKTSNPLKIELRLLLSVEALLVMLRVKLVISSQ